MQATSFTIWTPILALIASNFHVPWRRPFSPLNHPLWITQLGSRKIFPHVYTIRVLQSCDPISCFISSSHVNENIGWQIEPCFCVKLSPTQGEMTVFHNQINAVKTSVVSWHPITSIELICITWPKTSSLMLLNVCNFGKKSIWSWPWPESPSLCYIKYEQ